MQHKGTKATEEEPNEVSRKLNFNVEVLRQGISRIDNGSPFVNFVPLC